MVFNPKQLLRFNKQRLGAVQLFHLKVHPSDEQREQTTACIKSLSFTQRSDICLRELLVFNWLFALGLNPQGLGLMKVHRSNTVLSVFKIFAVCLLSYHQLHTFYFAGLSVFLSSLSDYFEVKSSFIDDANNFFLQHYIIDSDLTWSYDLLLLWFTITWIKSHD